MKERWIENEEVSPPFGSSIVASSQSPDPQVAGQPKTALGATSVLCLCG